MAVKTCYGRDRILGRGRKEIRDGAPSLHHFEEVPAALVVDDAVVDDIHEQEHQRPAAAVEQPQRTCSRRHQRQRRAPYFAKATADVVSTGLALILDS